jgi:hypothetical protein
MVKRERKYVAFSISLLSGIALRTLSGTTGSKTKPSRLTIRLTKLFDDLLYLPISETSERALLRRDDGLSRETFGICGARDAIIELGAATPVISVPVVLLTLPLIARLTALIAKPRGDGMSKSFAPHVERRESVNLPPYW